MVLQELQTYLCERERQKTPKLTEAFFPHDLTHPYTSKKQAH
jgi:hypothetical protein